MPEAEADNGEWEDDVEQHWGAFLTQQYQVIKNLLHGEKWLWDERALLPPQPPSQIGIGEFVKELVVANASFKFYAVGRKHKFVTFGLKEWEESARYRHNQEHGDGSWPLYFCVNIDKQGLRVCLFVSPGDQICRAKLFETAQKHSFTNCSKRLRNWCPLSTVPILNASDYGKTQEEANALIMERWAAYMRDELPRMAQAIREEPWLWEMP